DMVNYFKRLTGCRLHNHYGPTETHVVTALTLPEKPDAWPAFPSIGGPISNAQIYVLDRQEKPVPIGVSGEIYIGGAGVAQGYLHRPELTAHRFVNNPFDKATKLYRTGDLGRWMVDGNLEFLGRNDDQVKVRGYRIEVGEVEAQLARHERVREAVVLAREDIPGERRLVAYVRHDARHPSAAELRAHLERLLPEFMVPSAFVILSEFPLTPSGKLDRRALPPPAFTAYATQSYEAPQGEVEEVLADVWRGLLRAEK